MLFIWFETDYCYVLLIVISEFLEHHSKAKDTRAGHQLILMLWQIKGAVLRVVHGKLWSDFQRVRGDRVAVKVGVV